VTGEMPLATGRWSLATIIFMPPSSIAFFDVDHTLVDGNTGFFTSLLLVKKGILKKRRLFQAFYYLFTGHFVYHDVKKVYELILSDMAGQKINYLLELGKYCFEKSIRQRFFEDAIQSVRWHQSKGHSVVLMSSGPTMTLAAIEETLGLNHTFSIGPVIVDGQLTSKLPDPLCHAEGKLYYAKIYADEKGVPLENCYFYTDHFSDIPLLKEVGFPRVINPDRRLKKEARQKGWPIFRWKRHHVFHET